jgi:chitinase
MGTGAVAAVLGLTVGGGSVAGAAPAADTTPPSVPQNLHVCGQFNDNDVFCWDPSTDDSGSIYHYWVLVDGHQHCRPVATTCTMDSMILVANIQPGTYTITVQAVDRALNRSAPSDPIQTVVR